MQGTIPAVRSLLSRGHASVKDINSVGYTPLHVSLIRETVVRYIKAILMLRELLTLVSSLLQSIITQSFAKY